MIISMNNSVNSLSFAVAINRLQTAHLFKSFSNYHFGSFIFRWRRWSEPPLIDSEIINPFPFFATFIINHRDTRGVYRQKQPSPLQSFYCVHNTVALCPGIKCFQNLEQDGHHQHPIPLWVLTDWLINIISISWINNAYSWDYTPHSSLPFALGRDLQLYNSLHCLARWI